jgi:hypothetical protein
VTRDQLVSTVRDADAWLRPLPTPAGPDTPAGPGGVFARAGCVVHPDRRLGQLVRGRPPGITAHQWSSATRTPLAFVVGDTAHHAPLFVVELHDPARRGVGARRGDRMTDAVCEAVGLPLLRVESSACGLGSYARRLVEYVLDARAFTAGIAGTDGIHGLLPEEPTGYRDIIGRLPDGRTGFVNDLGAVARAAAVDAYVGGQLTDPIIRGLHVTWRDGTAEGWAWLEVREGRCLFERTRIWQPGFSCGVDPSRLAEDLATAAVGERLKNLDAAGPRLRDKRHLGTEFEELRRRRDEMVVPVAFDHITFD